VAAPLLLLGAALLAGIAAAQPRWGTEDAVVEQVSGNIVFVFDVSRSMDAQDITPSRLQVAREAVAEAMLRLNGDRVGLVIFAGNARPRFPLTSDVGAAATVVRSLETGTLLVSGGTSTGEALELAVATLGGEGGVVVLVTDGDDPSASAIGAARVFAERSGVELLIAPVGTVEGGSIPVFSRTTDRYELVTSETGAPVVTRLNEPFLAALAEASGGALLNDVTELARAAPSFASDLSRSSSPAEATVPVERFQWFALPAVVLALLALALNWRAPRRAGAIAGVALLALMAACATEAYELNEEALLALEAGDLDGAVSLLYDAAAESPDDAEIALNLSVALHEAGRYEEAIQTASRIERSPLLSVRARTQSLIGHHWFALGELERSLDAFREALLLDSEDDTARHDYEVVFRLLSEREQQAREPASRPDGGSGSNDSADSGGDGGQTAPGGGQSGEGAAPRQRPDNQDDLNQQLAAVGSQIDSLLQESPGELTAEQALAILDLQEERNRLSALRDGFLGFNTTDH